jgi:phage/plasmid-like protein (TIGR03299 family)
MLEQYGNETSFITARQSAWHRLGTVTDDCFTAEDALKKAHLADWNVRKELVQTASGLLLPNTYALIRDNPYVDGQIDALTENGRTVGNQYVPIQNEAHCDLLNALVDEGGAHFETAGSIRNGKEVFVTLKLPETMKIGGVDEVETYIAAINNHEGTAAFKLITTPTRIVCANTQAAALKNARSSFNIRHTVNGPKAIQEAREALGLTFKYIDDFQAEAEKMIQQTMTEAKFMEIVDQLVGKPDLTKPDARSTKSLVKVRDDMLWSFLESDTNDNIRGTNWAAYQAVTEFADWMYPVRGEDKGTKRALRTVTGGNDDLKTKAFSLLSV